MQLAGGIRVVTGEIRKDQPFRIGIIDINHEDIIFWTNYPEDGAVMFAMYATRLIITEGAKRKMKWRAV